jgi:small-conductance mechanosensitive channel
MWDILDSRDTVISWVTGPGLRIVVVVVAAVVASLLVRRLVRVLVRPQMLGPTAVLAGDVERLHRRERTVESFLGRTASTFITFAAGMVVLSELGINVAPLIASAGIVGLAVGFGAQTLVRDAIAGVFLLLENHYDIGDRVRLNGIEGHVTGISLRRTTVRGDDGAVHTIPNGSIAVTTNLSSVVDTETAETE